MRIAKAVIALLASGCAGSGGGDATGSTSSAGDELGGSGAGSTAATGEDTGPSEDPVVPPAAFRFDCVDLVRLGDADGSAFQAQLLESAWNDDIGGHLLNIVVDLRARAETTAELALVSGIGTAAADLCADGPSASSPIASEWAAGTAAWGRSDARGTCAVADATVRAEGTYTFALQPDEILYIYALTAVGAPFNCTLDATALDAVPLHAVSATLTQSGHALAGQLEGCLLESEADALCSCLGTLCTASSPEDLNPDGPCSACPRGTTPLLELLAGINPSEGCTATMGAPAFDLQLGFTAELLPEIPEPCAGG